MSSVYKIRQKKDRKRFKFPAANKKLPHTLKVIWERVLVSMDLMSGEIRIYLCKQPSAGWGSALTALRPLRTENPDPAYL